MATPQTDLPKQLLTLNTLEFHQIVIDGTAYELRSPEMMSIVLRDRVARHSARFDALYDKPRTEEESIEYAQLLATICPLVLDAPADVHAKIGDGQRETIIVAFSLLSPINRRRTAGAETDAPAARSPIGASSPPA